jgi:hypothetical protein
VRILDIDIAEQEKASGAPPSSQPDASPITVEPQEGALPVASRRSRKPRKAVDHGNRRTHPPSTPGPTPEEPSSNKPPNAGINLAVMPDEPRYCYCNQVSHGQMIACDNQNCSREWVGLVSAPSRAISLTSPSSFITSVSAYVKSLERENHGTVPIVQPI